MKDLYEIDRRLFFTQLCAVAATATLIGSTLKAETPAAGTQEDAPNTHNMLVVGTEAVFLSHLPMFDGLNEGKSDYTSPHRYQVILEARFSSGGKDVTAVYTEDRKNHPKTKMYTLSPTADFVLAKLFTPDAQKPELSSFRATVFRGHLERRGKPINGLKDIVVTVKQVIHAQKFEPADDKPEELTYFLFGKGMELFLAHSIIKPPDFDQVLSVKVQGHSFTDAELAKGIEVTIPGRSDKANERVQKAQQVTGLTQANGARALKFKLEADKEIYFEEGELLVPPTFEDTKLEKKGIKSAPDKSSDARRKTATSITTDVVNSMLPCRFVSEVRSTKGVTT